MRVRPILGRPSAERGHWNYGSIARTQPVLQDQRFSQVFSNFWAIALEFCSAHAGSVHGVVRRLHFASRTENRAVFRAALGPQNTEGLHVPVWPRSTSVEAVGFELGDSVL